MLASSIRDVDDAMVSWIRVNIDCERLEGRMESVVVSIGSKLQACSDQRARVAGI